MRQSNLKAYVTPTSMTEAISTLNGYSGNMRVVAGATDLFSVYNEGLDAVLDISKLQLDYIIEEDSLIRVGAATNFNQLIQSALIKKHFQTLWEAACNCADSSTRNAATFGGNLCSAVPSGDSIPPVLALEADLVLSGPQGERTVNACKFFTGPRQTVLQRNEILKEIILPKQTSKTGSSFAKIARTSLDLAIVNAAALVKLTPAGEIAEARVALGAVAPTVLRIPELEKSLVGQKGLPGNFEPFHKMILSAISPIDNVRGTAEYRRDMSLVLAKRTLENACQQAMQNK